MSDPVIRPTVSAARRCTIDGCSEARVGRFWCSRHYARWKRHGDPEAQVTKRATVWEKTKRPLDYVCEQYGIDANRFHQMWEEQGGQCAICRRPFEALVGKGANIDHCHATGAVRGLLCHFCNAAIGFLDDQPERASAAAEYLRVHSADTDV